MSLLSKKFCSNCGSEDMMLAAGGTTGNWVCKQCGHMGPALEKVIIGKEIKNKEKKK
jgi:DNA-directed RNA polymerase subunit M/transcription elongation factor TFIIS